MTSGKMGEVLLTSTLGRVIFYAKLDAAVPADSSTKAPSIRCSMARRRKRRKRRRRRKRRNQTARLSAQKIQPRGFDYGCMPYVMAFSPSEFVGHLNAASVDGVVYSSVWCEAVKRTVPTICLVARHGDELAKAFERFNAWSQMTDPDSVELTFVFQKSGGYTLTISPEYSRLDRRCLGFDRTNRVLNAGAIWVKPIRSVHPVLRKLRKHCSAPIAPFVFNGATYVGPRSVLTPSAPPDVSPIPGLQPLLKFEVTFIDEDDVTPNTIGWLGLKAGAGQLPTSPTGPRQTEPEDIAKQRVQTLVQHFPVTLERIRRDLSLPHLIRLLAASDVRPWQIEQALCNLVLSAEMGRGAHFIGLSDRKANSSIIQAIKSRYELANGDDIPTYPIEKVSTQIIADGNALLRYLKKKKCENIAGIQASLKSVSALEATTAVEFPSKWNVSV